jgi:hypothetical protein
MNREEREQYVIQLYKDGRTIRDIAGLVHMSFSQIGAITNKVKLFLPLAVLIKGKSLVYCVCKFFVEVQM